jgi:ribose transport system substrate-binding protein
MAAPKTVQDLSIVFVTPLIAHPVWDLAKNGFEAAAKEMGFKGQYVGPNGIDPAEMVNLIEINLASKVDGIITMPISPSAMRPVFKKCADAKTPVVFVGAVDPESVSLAQVATNEFNMTKKGADYLKQLYKGKPIRSIIMMSTMDASFAINCRDGYNAAFKGYDYKMVLAEACNSDQTIAMGEYEAAVKAHPEINMFISVCTEGGPAAAKAVKEMNLQGKIGIIGMDETTESVPYVKAGLMQAIVVQNVYQFGYAAAKALVDYIINGKKPVNPAIDPVCVVVTKDNADNYQKAF